MYNKSEQNIVIIGGNAAGAAAAAKAKRVNPNAKVTLLEAGNFISTGTCEIPYVLSKKIESYNDIVFFTPESFEEKKGVKVLINHLATNINRKDKIVEVKNLGNNLSHSIPYDKLIVATGADAKDIPSINSKLNNVFKIKTVTQLVKIKKYLEENKVNRIAIWGSGYIGLELTEAFTELGIKVLLFEKEELPMPSADEEIKQIILKILKEKEIEFWGNSTKTKVIDDGNKITHIKVEGWLKEIDIAVVAAGIKPNISLLKSCGIEIGSTGAVKVDRKMKTSDYNIFSAGDNTESVNAITGRPFYLPLATTARRVGYIAGSNASGGNEYASPFIKNIALKFFDKALTIVGLSTKEAEEHFPYVKTVSVVLPNLVTVMPESKTVFGKIIYDGYTKQILGASFLGEKEVIGYADLISTMIYNKISVQSLDKYDYNYTPPLSPFANILSVLGKKINEQNK